MKLFKQSIVILFILTILLSGHALVQAASDLPSDIVGGVQSAGGKSGLPSYAPGAPQTQGKPHPKSSYYSGATELTSVILYTVDFLKYVIAPLAVFYLIIASIKLITAGNKIDEVVTSEKESIQWVILGLMTIFVANTLVYDVFFGAEGDVLSDTDLSQDYAITGANNIRGLYNMVRLIIPFIAVLVIIVSGFRLIVQSYDEEAAKSARGHIIWAIVGLVFIGLAELLVEIFFPYFPEETDRDFFVDTEKLTELILSITNFTVGFITTVAVAAMSYAGYLYVAFFGQDNMVEKAKKIIKGAIIAILIAGGAFAFVKTFIVLKAFI